MTTSNNTVLGGTTDDTSFLVPCLAFMDARDAASYEGNRAYLNDLLPSSPSDVFASVNFGSKVYVPRVNRLHRRFHADELLTGKGALYEPRWEKLRDKANAFPSTSAFNVCLLVDGPRKFSLYHPLSHRVSALWQRLCDGDRDAFAVWGRPNGQPLGRHQEMDGQNHVVASTHGRGALFACTSKFSNDGAPKGFTTRLIRVEFSVRDSDPAKDDMVQVKVFRGIAHTELEEGPYNWAAGEEDAGWKSLIERAHSGFFQFCKTVPKETESFRKFFIDQIDHLDDDKLISNGTSYRDQTRAVSVQQALDNVYMPWHLQVVIDVHCRPGQFEDSPHRYGTNSTRVRNMLAAYECSSERRQQLQAMVTHFVQPNDNKWSWSGD